VSWDDEYKYKLKEQNLIFKEFLKHEKKYAKDLENRNLFERIFNIKPKRKEWICVKMPYRFDESKYSNKDKVNNIKGDNNMKITSWKQFKGLENGRGLYTEAYLLSNDNNFCNFYVTDDKNRLMLGTYPTNDLSNLVETLRKYGFDIEYRTPFNLIKLLKESIEPKKFVLTECNYCFEERNNDIEFCELGLYIFGASYFKFKNKPFNLDSFLAENKVTTIQLKEALKELEWIK